MWAPLKIEQLFIVSPFRKDESWDLESLSKKLHNLAWYSVIVDPWVGFFPRILKKNLTCPAFFWFVHGPGSCNLQGRWMVYSVDCQKVAIEEQMSTGDSGMINKWDLHKPLDAYGPVHSLDITSHLIKWITLQQMVITVTQNLKILILHQTVISALPEYSASWCCDLCCALITRIFWLVAS